MASITFTHTLNPDTTKPTTMLLEIEKHLKIVNAQNQSKGLLILILFHRNKRLKYTHILYMIILQNSPSMIMNLYLLSIQKAPFITVTMLTHYKC